RDSDLQFQFHFPYQMPRASFERGITTCIAKGEVLKNDRLWPWQELGAALGDYDLSARDWEEGHKDKRPRSEWIIKAGRALALDTWIVKSPVAEKALCIDAKFFLPYFFQLDASELDGLLEAHSARDTIPFGKRLLKYILGLCPTHMPHYLPSGKKEGSLV